MQEADVTRNVQRLVQNMNDAWLEQRFDDLASYFTESVVMVPPGGSRLEGRDAMVDSFRQFLAVAQVHAFGAERLDVDRVGTAAIATLRFRIDYEIRGERSEERGTEVLGCVPDADQWRIAWRAQFPG